MFSFWILSSLFLADLYSGGWTAPVNKLDMSHAFNTDSLFWPRGQRNFSHDIFSDSTAEVGWYQGGQFMSGEHGGTHIDAPIHFARGGWAVDEIPLERLEAPAVVLDVRAKVIDNRNYGVTVDDILAWEESNGPLPEGAVLFMCSGWDTRWPDKLAVFGNDQEDVTNFHFPGFHADTAKWLVDNRNIAGVGVDTPGIDVGNSTGFVVHTTLMARNIYGLENVKGACQLPQGATVNLYPMKIEGASGGPVGIIATWDDSGSNGAPSLAVLQPLCIPAMLSILIIMVLIRVFWRKNEKDKSKWY